MTNWQIITIIYKEKQKKSKNKNNIVAFDSKKCAMKSHYIVMSYPGIYKTSNRNVMINH